MKKQPLKYIRHQLITAAKELCYSQEVISKLEKAETEEEMSRIMNDARRSYL